MQNQMNDEVESSNIGRLQALCEFFKMVAKAHDRIGVDLSQAAEFLRKRLAVDTGDGRKLSVKSIGEELFRNAELDAQEHRDLAKELMQTVMGGLEEICGPKREALTRLLRQRSNLQALINTARDECKQTLGALNSANARASKTAQNTYFLTAIGTNEMISEYRRVVLPAINNDIHEIESFAGLMFLDANDVYCTASADLGDARRMRYEAAKKAKITREVRRSLDQPASSENGSLDLVPTHFSAIENEGQLLVEEETNGQLTAKLESLQSEARNLSALVKKKQDTFERLRDQKSASDSRRSAGNDKQRGEAPAQVSEARFELHQQALKLARVRSQADAITKARDGRADGIDTVQPSGGRNNGRLSIGSITSGRSNPPIAMADIPHDTGGRRQSTASSSSRRPSTSTAAGKNNLKSLWSKAVRALRSSSPTDEGEEENKRELTEEEAAAETAALAEKRRQDEVYETLLSATMLAQRKLMRNSSQTSGGSASSTTSVNAPSEISVLAASAALIAAKTTRGKKTSSVSSGIASSISNASNGQIVEDQDGEVDKEQPGRQSNAMRKGTSLMKNTFASRKTYSVDESDR